LVRAACGIVGAEPPVGLLGPAIAKYDQRVAGMLAENDELAAYVSRLEVLMGDAADDERDAVVDELADDERDAVVDELADDELDDAELAAEDLVAEVERYLQESGPDAPSDGA